MTWIASVWRVAAITNLPWREPLLRFWAVILVAAFGIGFSQAGRGVPEPAAVVIRGGLLPGVEEDLARRGFRVDPADGSSIGRRVGLALRSRGDAETIELDVLPPADLPVETRDRWIRAAVSAVQDAGDRARSRYVAERGLPPFLARPVEGRLASEPASVRPTRNAALAGSAAPVQAVIALALFPGMLLAARSLGGGRTAGRLESLVPTSATPAQHLVAIAAASLAISAACCLAALAIVFGLARVDGTVPHPGVWAALPLGASGTLLAVPVVAAAMVGARTQSGLGWRSGVASGAVGGILAGPFAVAAVFGTPDALPFLPFQSGMLALAGRVPSTSEAAWCAGATVLTIVAAWAWALRVYTVEAWSRLES